MNKTMYDSREQKKIGMLTPSSNTTLEPVCSAMVHGLEDVVTMHYARFEVTKISLEPDALSQFDFSPMLRAAELLAHADVDLIAWNGTSGGWLGFDIDEELCRKITESTGIPATTSMLAQLKAFELHGAHSIHMVTPYLKPINGLLREQYEKYGIRVINDSCLEQSVNRSFSLVDKDRIMQMCSDVCCERADGLSIVCTNLPAVWYSEEIERLYDITVYDTISVVVWQALRMLNIDTSLVKGWGRIFQN